MATTLEIIRGLSQAAANAYDGGHDEKYSYDGEARSAGLNREKGDVVLDSRTMDGFKIRLSGDRVTILYHQECLLKDTHQSDFTSEIERHLADIAKYLRGEYKKVTGEGLTLTKDGDAKIDIEYISRIRTSVRATQTYKVGGLSSMDSKEDQTSEDRLDKSFKDFLAIGKDKYPNTKKPENVSTKIK